MIFRQEFLTKIKAGKVKIAFRRWNKLSVKSGGTLKTAVGVLRFTKIEIVNENRLTEKEAKAAGFYSLEALLSELNQRSTSGTIYKIHFKVIGDDPRIKLREQSKLESDDLDDLIEKLQRLDRYSKAGPWTKSVMMLLDKNPGIGSKILSPKVKMEQSAFKLNVRKLKNLGLTISLGTGYKLSPRGKILLKKLK